MLTKHFKLTKEFVPTYTGGAFIPLKDNKHALAMNEGKITLMSLQNGNVLGELELDNEEILNFAISPNQ